MATAVPESVYNFRILSSDERTITFSWEILGIHYSYTTGFRIYYSCDASDQEDSLYFSWVDRSSISTGRTHFNHTIALTRLTSQCQQSTSYVMWLTMPGPVGGRTLHSQQIYTETCEYIDCTCRHASVDK